MMMTKRELAVWTVGVAAVATVLAGVALATPGSNAVGTILARAGFADPVDITFKVTKDNGNGSEVLHVHDAQDTVIQQIVFGPDGHTGWHSHPGPVVVLVTEGALTLYSGDDPTCTGRTYSAGQAFIDRGQGHVHIGRNPSPTANTVLWVTYFDVPPAGAVRVDAADPGNCVF
jgi:quercetin dioxygenase-like cupin family protein